MRTATISLRKSEGKVLPSHTWSRESGILWVNRLQWTTSKKNMKFASWSAKVQSLARKNIKMISKKSFSKPTGLFSLGWTIDY